MELRDLVFIMDGNVQLLKVPHTATVRDVLQLVRAQHGISTFSSLELRINGNRLKAKKPVFRLSLGSQQPRVEIIRRNCWDCL